MPLSPRSLAHLSPSPPLFSPQSSASRNAGRAIFSTRTSGPRSRSPWASAGSTSASSRPTSRPSTRASPSARTTRAPTSTPSSTTARTCRSSRASRRGSWTPSRARPDVAHAPPHPHRQPQLRGRGCHAHRALSRLHAELSCMQEHAAWQARERESWSRSASAVGTGEQGANRL